MDLSSMEEFKFLTADKINIYCDLSSLCRICLEQIDVNKKSKNVFDKCDECIIVNMIMSCASVQVAEGDGLPNFICQECLTKLNIAFQFKTLCESSDSKLKEILMNTSSVGFVPDNSQEQNECIYDVLKDNVKSEVFKEDDRKEELKTEYDENNKVNKRGKRSTKNHQCDTCGKTFNRKEYLTQHLRIHTGEKPYHCHLCEKRFINSGHLITHMRKHTGEKPHHCTMCPKSFSTKQELTKHIMVHKGEKPYVCNVCGKTFGSSSNLYTHMKHHTGEKAFVCEFCSKSFITKHELKQHHVVHTGIKAFLCEYCNKRFSQIAHLKRHLKLHTKM